MALIHRCGARSAFIFLGELFSCRIPITFIPPIQIYLQLYSMVPVGNRRVCPRSSDGLAALMRSAVQNIPRGQIATTLDYNGASPELCSTVRCYGVISAPFHKVQMPTGKNIYFVK